MFRSSDSAQGPGLALHGVTCERGGRIVFEALALALAPGAAMLVLGPNGSGKTTLLRVLAGLTEPSAGTVAWNGEPGNVRSAAWRRRIAYAGHKSAHKDDLSAAENLDLACELEGANVGSSERLQALQRVGLARRSTVLVKRLSQGQKQRLTLARLSVSARPLWLLDEPAAALDSDARELLAELLTEHLARGGAALVATHDPIVLPGQRVAELRLG